MRKETIKRGTEILNHIIKLEAEVQNKKELIEAVKHHNANSTHKISIKDSYKKYTSSESITVNMTIEFEITKEEIIKKLEKELYIKSNLLKKHQRELNDLKD